MLSGAVVQALEYTYYVNGQVEARTDSEYGQDHYWYDEVGRLAVHEKRDAAGGFLDRRGFDYYPNGNIATYQGSGHDELTYSTTRPQHVVGAGSHLAHEYDELGRVIERSGEDVAGLVQQIAYRSFDLPSRITTGAGPEPIVTEYEYTAGAVRVSEHNGRRAHYLVGDAYEAVTSDVTGELEEEHYRIFAGGRAIAEITRDAAGADRVEYLHADALGSTDAISGESGETVRQGWEAFGGWDTERSEPAMSGLETRVGFTGQLDDHGTGLINMKGRLYDPLVGRFMTADPVVQAPFWSQGHNQYSYVFNDPANLVDPSGYSGEWAYSNAGVGLGMWGGALMGGTALGAASFSGLGSGSGAAGGTAGTGLGKMLAGMIGGGAHSKAISPVMPSTTPKGAGAPTGSSGAKGQQGAPGGGVGGGLPRYGGGASGVDNGEFAQEGRGGGGPEVARIDEGALLVMNGAGTYGLSEAGHKRLDHIFAHFGYDLGRTRVQFTGGVKLAEAEGDVIRINPREWLSRARQGEVYQAELLAHEITHSVQFDRAGYWNVRFRVGTERFKYFFDNYAPPDALFDQGLATIDPVDSRYSLEQIATRVQTQVFILVR